jgi:hypothetical protein
VIVSDKLCVFVGPFVTDALIVIGTVPALAFDVVLIVNVSATGLLEVTITEPEGRKLQVAPEGRFPQDRFTVSLKGPCPVTWNETGGDVLDGATVMAPGDGAVRLKSTTFRVTGESWVSVSGSVPTPCTKKA